GSVDTLARLIQPKLQEKLGRTVLVESRPGAGGRIAAASLLREPKDGTAILITPNALTTIQTLVYEGQLEYDMMRDIQPLSRLVSFPMGIVVAETSPVKNMNDLKAY